jgi:uncharacterized membrane protein YfcA
LLQSITNFTGFSSEIIIILLITAFGAGLVRGFSGFALSATVMAVMANFVPPIQLAPICLCLELVASIMMMRGGLKQADMGVVWGLVIGSVIGTPVGYLILVNIEATTARLVALVIITTLSLLLFMRVRANFLNTKPGLYISGIGAGFAGIATVGGMVVALYVLAREKAAAEMRGSLVMYLMISLVSTTLFQILFDILTIEAVKRAAVMIPVLIIGILIGSAFFRPSLEKYYKPFCLLTLIAICLIGLVRLAI